MIHLPDSTFGLQQNDGNGVSFGFDYVPDAKSVGRRVVRVRALPHAAGVAAGEFGRRLQRSDEGLDDRQRTDHAHTIDASIDLLKFWPKTDVRFGYDFTYATIDCTSTA